MRFFSYPKHSAKKQQHHLADISADGQARLLDMAYARLRFGFASMPIISAIFAWYYYQDISRENIGPMIWSCFYFVWFGLSFFLLRFYRRDQKKLTAEMLLKKWLPKFHVIAIIHGLSIAALLPIVSATATYEFKLLYILTVAAIMAANSTHQSPMLSIFHRFLAACWHFSVILMPWTFQNYWQFTMPLAAIYSVSMHYYSISSHLFFIQLIWLEEEGARLAKSYKLAKETAEKALHEKNQFLTTASHDLRQPVHAMGFLIESIVQRNQDVSLNPALKDLKQSVRSITQMFNALLDLSKIESGKIALRISNIDLQILIDEITTLLAEEARSKNIEIRIWLSKTNAIARADRVLLQQSIMNLMHNALRYTKKGGILIAVRKRGKYWLVEVWDTGVGVAIEDQDNLYSPFYRNEHAWQIDNAGHGLGLSVVARCCKLMQAEYGFDSKLGRGSRFWLKLPAVDTSLSAMQIIDKIHLAQAQTVRVALTGACLIIDDDPQVIDAWHSLLSSWGLQVECAESATQAFAVLENGFQPQVILCDQRLRAGESGFDLLRALMAACPKASGAMISGEFNSPELIQAENEGYLVLHKPLEPDVLLTLLSRWLNNTNAI